MKRSWGGGDSEGSLRTKHSAISVTLINFIIVCKEMSDIVSEKGIEKINACSKLVLRKRGEAAVEFYNDAHRLYVLHFIEVADIGGHRVMYIMTRLADGQRGGAADKEVGRMIVTAILQYLEEHPDDLVCFSHHDNCLSNAINRIYHVWADANKDLYDGQYSYFDGVGHDADNRGLHFMVMHHLACQDIAELKAFILENSDDFAVIVREQILLLHDIEKKQHQIGDSVHRISKM